MTEAVTLTNEELAILCDIVAGWSVKHSENLNADKRLALNRLIANEFIEQANGLRSQTINTPPKPSCFSLNCASE